MNLTVEDLKVIRLALATCQISSQLMETINNVDAELAKHNLKAVYKSTPKRPYQRKREGTYIFESIN